MTVKKPKTALKKRGRKTLYTQKIADEICERISQGVSEREIADIPGMPSYRTIQDWKGRYPEFLHQSARARKESAQYYDDCRHKIISDLHVQLQRHMAHGGDFPRGAVEAYRVLIQELARDAALRDDENFGDRKKVDVSTNAPIQVVFKDDLED